MNFNPPLLSTFELKKAACKISGGHRFSPLFKAWGYLWSKNCKISYDSLVRSNWALWDYDFVGSNWSSGMRGNNENKFFPKNGTDIAPSICYS